MGKKGTKFIEHEENDQIAYMLCPTWVRKEPSSFNRVRKVPSSFNMGKKGTKFIQHEPSSFNMKKMINMNTIKMKTFALKLVSHYIFFKTIKENTDIPCN